jgi:hypothetical protein
MTIVFVSKANGMSTLEIDVGDIRPVSVAFAADELVVTLADGRKIATPLAWLASPGCCGAAPPPKACCPCFETLAPQHEVVVFQQR